MNFAINIGKIFLWIPLLIRLAAQTGFGRESGTIPENVGTVKNVIIMIPGGTSTSVLSLARWYQNYNGNESIGLNVDEVITGLVKTNCSDVPGSDAAAAGSALATGIDTRLGYVAVYPEKTANDIVFVDTLFARTPAMTILEAAKLKGMATGLAVTSHFSHATPAAFSAHSYNQNRNDWLTSQMINSQIDVVFGGGSYYLVPGYRHYLAQNGWEVVIDDYQKFRSFSGEKIWGLFSEYELPYDIDRNPAVSPSLAEMTEKAIETLSKNENGFFLMVEGSKTERAAQTNDAVGMITDFIAFDKAVKEALDFAKKDGNTAVIICPNYGVGAAGMGNQVSGIGYERLNKKQLLGPVVACKNTAEGFAAALLQNGSDETAIRKKFAADMGIGEVTEPEMREIQTAMERRNAEVLQNVIIKMIKARTFIGFATEGNTGEDVFLACYHPKGTVLKGMVTNTDVNKYMCRLMEIESLADSTRKYFAGHKTLFPADQYDVLWDKKDAMPSVIVKSKKSKKMLSMAAFNNKAILSIPGKKKQIIQLKTVIVYIDKNEEFYLPNTLKNLIE